MFLLEPKYCINNTFQGVFVFTHYDEKTTTYGSRHPDVRQTLKGTESVDNYHWLCSYSSYCIDNFGLQGVKSVAYLCGYK